VRVALASIGVIWETLMAAMPDHSSNPSFRPGAVVGTTLREHVLHGMHAAPGATGEFTSLLNHISLAIRIINSRVRSAGLAGLLGYTGETNVQGEAVQLLDQFSNDVLLNVLERSGHCGVVASEELDEAILAKNHGKYVALFDPLDGSSNIDTNVGIGTIFAILRRSDPKLSLPSLADALRPGREIVAAGYVLYGPSTIFVLSTGQGAHGFTLDPMIGEFFLSQPNIKCPSRGSCFSVNEGNYSRWSPEIQKWARWIKGDGPPSGETDGFKTPYGARYVGSLVADAHRTLVKGGIFAYPADTKSTNGKLRLLYEANPMAFLFEQAGGGATNGKERILDIVPSELHQRTPLIVGSIDDVAAFRQFMLGER
jgi:fructose-1,6-bisphosphatase I